MHKLNYNSHKNIADLKDRKLKLKNGIFQESKRVRRIEEYRQREDREESFLLGLLFDDIPQYDEPFYSPEKYLFTVLALYL
jgi:hypothetical protein